MGTSVNRHQKAKSLQAKGGRGCGMGEVESGGLVFRRLNPVLSGCTLELMGCCVGGWVLRSPS